MDGLKSLRENSLKPHKTLTPGRVPHVRPSEHPDFLSSSLALTNFKRLSQRFCYGAKRLRPKSESPCAWSESIGKIRSRPMYALANMGHPSSTTDRGWGSNPPELADLI